MPCTSILSMTLPLPGCAVPQPLQRDGAVRGAAAAPGAALRHAPHAVPSLLCCVYF